MSCPSAIIIVPKTVKLLNKDPWYSGVLEDIARRVGAIS